MEYIVSRNETDLFENMKDIFEARMRKGRMVGISKFVILVDPELVGYGQQETAVIEGS